MTLIERSATGDIPKIVIVGGGFSGAVLAWHLHRAAPYRHNIVIVEPRDEIGRGLAYDTTDPAHRINVPAQKMNFDFDEEGHFEQWLVASDYAARDPAALAGGGHLFPTRAAFGAYVHAHIRLLGRAVTHRKTTAQAVLPQPNGYQVICADGHEIEADIVVLAVCHTPPQIPASLKALQDHPRFIANPWRPRALGEIESNDRVLIVGTGLTMADIVASLDRQNHRGHITAVSRRGLRSQSHATREMEPFGNFTEAPSRSALSLLRRVRNSIKDAAREDLTWHPVLDQLRLQGTDIWRALPQPERKKLVHRLRPFWDTYRFRIAPQIDGVIKRRIQDGTLDIRAASLRASATQDERLEVDIRPRRARNWERLAFDAVVVATGPAHGSVFDTNPLLTQVGEAGLARPDPLGLGIDVDDLGHAIGRDGQSIETLFVAGPLARGTFGELMGVPDLARYTRDIAQTIAHKGAIGRQLPPPPVRA